MDQKIYKFACRHKLYIFRCNTIPKTVCTNNLRKVSENICSEMPTQTCKKVPKEVKFTQTLNLTNKYFLLVKKVKKKKTKKRIENKLFLSFQN